MRVLKYKPLATIRKHEEGYQFIEYTLLVALIIIPLVKAVPYLVDMLRTFFEMESFTVSLPFP